MLGEECRNRRSLEKEALQQFVAWGLAEQEEVSLSWAACVGACFHEFVYSLLKMFGNHVHDFSSTAHQPVILNCCLLVSLPAP